MFFRRIKKRAVMMMTVAMLTVSSAVSTFPSEAAAAKGGWKQINGKWYWYTAEHEKKTGWIRVRGNWYYLDKEGAMSTGLRDINGRQYYFNKDGEMQTGWIRLEGKWYFFNSYGIKRTGWLSLDDNWYYLDADGVMLTGWHEIDGKRYYFRADGIMKTGWQKTEGEWYLLSDSGSMLSDGWLVRDGHTYHFDADGKMDVNTTKSQKLVSMPGYYISPMYAGDLNTPEERIEAMIRRAYDYRNAGTKFKICKSMAPGQYADCSGLVMQCLYAAGFDPSPATPAHHARPENEYDSRTLYNYVNMRHVAFKDIKRGDLIFYRRKGTKIINHVAIYLGNGRVIESWSPAVTDKYGVASYPHSYIYGVARPFE